MNEFVPQSNPELERERSLIRIVEQYFPEDMEFMQGVDFDELLDFVFGQLIEDGENPDEILLEFGVPGKNMNNEQIPQFAVTEMTAEMIEEATDMRHKSWLDTYVNEGLGVTREWIETRNQRQHTPEHMRSRVERFMSGKANGTFNAWVARDEHGKIIGSTTPFVDEEGRQHIGSLYVDKDCHGKGVAGQLMQKAIDWFDPAKPIELGVATYNERAKAFYRKRGFEEVPDSETLFDEKIPEVLMVRKGEE